MKGLARCTDLTAGVCCCHDGCIGTVGIIVNCSGNTSTNQKGNARCYDLVIGNCGHLGIIVTCSDTVRVNKIGQARCGDVVVGCLNHIVVSCSENSNTA